MSFDLADNAFQVSVLVAAAAAAFALALRRRDRRLLVLGLGYASFAMGTLYYALFLAVTGDIPRVFYVSEVSWVAAYAFMLSLQAMRAGAPPRRRPAPVPALCAALAAGAVVGFQMMGPSPVVCAAFAAVLGALAYSCAARLAAGGPGRPLDACLLACVALQLGVYASSTFIDDYTGFSPYFALDIALTCCLAALLPLTAREAPPADEGEAGRPEDSGQPGGAA